MRAAFVASILVVLFRAAAPAAPVPTHLMRPSVIEGVYYPTGCAGWVYDAPGGEEKLGIKEQPQVFEGETVATVEIDVKTGGSMVVDFVAVSGRGLESRYASGERRRVLLPVPSRVGDTWEDTIDGVKFRSKILRTERLKVPAGTLPCVCVETRSAAPGKPRTCATIWYAPGVGMVKRTDDNGTWLLKEFWPG